MLGVEFRTPMSVWDGTFWENVWQYYQYSLSQGVTCYVLSGFRNSPLISIHIIIQLSLLLYFSKYIRLRQYYEFPFILRDLRHIYRRVLRQLRANSKTWAMTGRCKFIECVVVSMCSMSKHKKMSFYLFRFPDYQMNYHEV